MTGYVLLGEREERLHFICEQRKQVLALQIICRGFYFFGLILLSHWQES